MRKKRVVEVNNQLIERLYEFKRNGVSYIDALTELHETLNIEMEDLIEMVPNEILHEIKVEFVQKRMIRDDGDLNQEVDIRKRLNNIMDFLEESDIEDNE